MPLEKSIYLLILWAAKKMANPVEKIERNIDYKIVTSTVVAALIVAGVFFAMRQSGVKILKQVAA